MDEQDYIFTQETIDALAELGAVLRKINKRMHDEGYQVVNGKIVSIETGEVWRRKN